MSELIEMVEGGYQRVNSDDKEIIPANELMTFGGWEDFEDNSKWSHKINFYKDGFSQIIESHQERIKNDAEEYSTKMKAPFYRLRFENNIQPGGIFQESMKKATVSTRGKIQLYVYNK